MTSENEVWDPISLAEVSNIFAKAPFRWWIAGCHALELHLVRSWRDHSDIDISFCRIDQAAVWQFLVGWHISIASRGVLTPWFGEPLLIELHQNNLWCKKELADPWSFDLTVSAGNDSEWIFRRDQSLRMPWGQAVLRSAEGIPYLAPELQLLYKSKDSRDKDNLDAVEVIPRLNLDRQNFLRRALPKEHPWRSLL